MCQQWGLLGGLSPWDEVGPWGSLGPLGGLGPLGSLGPSRGVFTGLSLEGGHLGPLRCCLGPSKVGLGLWGSLGPLGGLIWVSVG